MPCRKDPAGTCHVDGDLLLMSPEILSPLQPELHGLTYGHRGRLTS